MSDAIGARVRTALDRLEAAEKDLSLAARRVTEAREVLRTAFADERVPHSGGCPKSEVGTCNCGSK